MYCITTNRNIEVKNLTSFKSIVLNYSTLINDVFPALEAFLLMKLINMRFGAKRALT